MKALIFDVDGTLAETEEAHREAFNAAFAAAGLAWSWDPGLYGDLLAVTGGKERIAAFAARIGAGIDPAAVATLHRDKTERYTAAVAAGDVVLRPGVRALIEEARAARLALAVATTTSPQNVDALVAAAFGVPAAGVFDVVAAGDEVAVKKPAPDVYRLALARLGLPATACLAIEDSANGVRAALAAGIACLVTPSAYTQGEDFAGAAFAPSLDGVGLAELRALAAA